MTGSGKRSRISVPRPAEAVRELIAGHASKHHEFIEQREIAAAAKVSAGALFGGRACCGTRGSHPLALLLITRAHRRKAG